MIDSVKMFFNLRNSVDSITPTQWKSINHESLLTPMENRCISNKNYVQPEKQQISLEKHRFTSLNKKPKQNLIHDLNRINPGRNVNLAKEKESNVKPIKSIRGKFNYWKTTDWLRAPPK